MTPAKAVAPRTVADVGPDDFLTVAEVARVFNVATGTVRHWIATGRMRAHRVAGTTIRISGSEVLGAFEPAGPEAGGR